MGFFVDAVIINIPDFRSFIFPLCFFQVGVSTLALGLQYNRFWAHSFSDTIDYLKQHNLPVIILMRQNYLAHFIAENGRKGRRKHSENLPKQILEHLPLHARRFRNKCLELCCALQANNVCNKKIQKWEFPGISRQRKPGQNHFFFF